MNLVDLLAASAQTSPESLAILEEERRISYGQLYELVLKTGSWLEKIGVNPGDRVLVMLPNNLEFILCYLGCAACGAIAVPINWMCRELEIRHYLLDCTPTACLTLGKLLPAIQKACAELANPPQIIALDKLSSEGASLTDLLPTLSSTRTKDVRAADIAAIIYTNATDGFPRGAMLSHGNLRADANITVSHWNTTGDDMVAAILPFFHTYGATTSILSPIVNGLPILIMPHFNPKEVCRLIQKFRPTIVSMVPTMFAALLGFENVHDFDLSCIRIWISGGMALPKKVQIGFEQLINTEIREGYGITEASPCASFNWLEHPRKIGSIGKILRGLHGIIADPQGHELPPNTTGELLIKGETIMQGYLNDPTLSQRTVIDGWLYTGDLGYMDADGFVFLTGRLRDMYITGGFNVYPNEVRRLLKTHPDIEDVALVATPDLAYGEVGHAIVTVKSSSTLSEDGLNSFCRRVMALYKIPRTFEIKSL